MWALRILSGQLAGQTFPLNSGKNLLGRAPECEIHLAEPGISKHHAQILVTEDKVILSDLGSKNGTYVNGVRIQNQTLRLGDKVLFYNLIAEFIRRPPARATTRTALPGPTAVPPMPMQGAPAAMTPGMAPGPMNGMPGNPFPPSAAPEGEEHSDVIQIRSFQDLLKGFTKYVENVALPGVYRVAQMMEFKNLYIAAIVLFTLLVTATSVIPMAQLTKKNIQRESERRALTIAKSLASANRSAIVEGMNLALNTEYAEREEGVDKAFLISTQTGRILAPVNLSTQYLNNPFVQKARKTDQDFSEIINSTEIGASSPVKVYDPTLGTHSVRAHAIILYNLNETAIDFKSTLSLFIQVLLVALLLGFVLFYILFKVIAHPIRQVNAHLDQALKSGQTDIDTDYHLPHLEELISNINSTLVRLGQEQPEAENFPMVAADRMSEAAQIVDMMGWPCIAVRASNETIICANGAFYDLVAGMDTLDGRDMDAISDSAMRESLKDLLAQLMAGAPRAEHQLPGHGHEVFQVSAQAVHGSQGPEYFIISLKNFEEGQEDAV